MQEIKERIRQVGALEFRILANNRNDEKALNAAMKFFEDAKTNARVKDELENLALIGSPPPPPENPDVRDARDPKEKLIFDTPLGNFSYSWVEMGKSMRHDMGLDNGTEEALKQKAALEKKLAEGKQLTEQERALLERATRYGQSWEEARKHREAGEAYIPAGSSILIWSRAEKSINLSKEDADKKYAYFVLTRDPLPGKEITGEYLSSASEGTDSRGGGWAVHFRLDGTGAERFRELTSANKPIGSGQGAFQTRLAIVLDGLVMSAPNIQSTISGEGQITGGFTKTQVDRLVNILRSGALPATLKPLPVSENTIGATLGEDTIRAGFWSIVIAFLAVLVFMVIYYRFAGLVACVALFANLVLTLAFMVVVKATFTLPGLAGLVLMLGMAVDANVLIYERIREERDRGASLLLAIRNGYDRAFPAIIDTHLTSIFTAIVLYIVGNDQLKGFGISLTSGLAISLWTSLYMTRTIFDIGLANNWIKELRMMRFLSRPNINFMAIRHVMFAVTVGLSVAGIALFGYRVSTGGLNIDFVGGTAFTGRLANSENIVTLRRLLGEECQAQALQAEVEEVPGGEGQAFKITYAAGQARVKDADGKEIELNYPAETRTVHLPNPDKAENVRQHARALPDLSVEQIFRSDAPANANGSDVFNVRTTERSPDLVFAALDRLLGNRLKKVACQYKVGED
ncbi:MAG TPA: protein translocase subunit SecD, partial [Gemmataceae bacterium]|nr:protein translocase subunit SecD [Gemmataceae bacterium]